MLPTEEAGAILRVEGKRQFRHRRQCYLNKHQSVKRIRSRVLLHLTSRSFLCLSEAVRLCSPCLVCARPLGRQNLAARHTPCLGERNMSVGRCPTFTAESHCRFRYEAPLPQLKHSKLSKSAQSRTSPV
jgi:hypothetical protein